MILINTASIFFLKEKLGKITFAVWNGNGLTMVILFAQFGYNRLLGLSHILWWTPLFIYFWKVRKNARESKIFNQWFWILFVTIGLSLLLDYVDVIRYFMPKHS